MEGEIRVVGSNPTSSAHPLKHILERFFFQAPSWTFHGLMSSNRHFGGVAILNLGTADSTRMSHTRERALMSKLLKSYNTHEFLSSAQIQTTSTGLLQLLDISPDA